MFKVNEKGCLVKVNVNRTKIEQLTLPSNICHIGENVFYRFFVLEKVENTGSITNIGAEAFYECTKLKDIKLSDDLEYIGEKAFYKCSSLRNINLPDSLKFIKSGAFYGCESLTEVKIPASIITLEEEVFGRCKNLKTAILPNKILVIDDRVFTGCMNLTEVTFPPYLNEIGTEAFFACKKLEKVIIPTGVKKINMSTFANCSGLKEIILPPSVKKICSSAFSECTSLKKINFPGELKIIETRAFFDCIELKHLDFPPSLKRINSFAFAHCKKLEAVSFPESLEEIEYSAFCNCSKIKEFKLRNFSLLNCNGLKEYLESFQYYYLDESTHELIMCQTDIQPNNRCKKINYEAYLQELNCSKAEAIIISTMLSLDSLKNKNFRNISLILGLLTKENITSSNYLEIANNLNNNKEFNNLIKKIGTIDNTYVLYDLFKLAYSLGAFNNTQIERQKACEFLANILDKNFLSIDSLHGSFNNMKFKGFNKEWSEFLMNKTNFLKSIEKEKEQSGFISRIYNDFEEIKEFNRSNMGSQRYRKVTCEVSEEYFSKIHFDGVNENTVDISEAIGKFTKDQELFEDAVKIREEFLKMKAEGKIKEHILEIELKEDVFNQIEDERKFICNSAGECLNALNSIANKKFSYEFLSKNDPVNFVLGKYCSCCANIDGAGYGIMKASILHPDCQNLVIRDQDGVIIAKSTIYVNRTQGYAVFNNVEINDNIKDNESKELIYIKYKRAIEKFVSEYNKIYFDNPIRQINVGMNLNNLEDQIKKYDIKSNQILEGVNFSLFGRKNSNYVGDWQKSQYVIWQKGKKIA